VQLVEDATECMPGDNSVSAHVDISALNPRPGEFDEPPPPSRNAQRVWASSYYVLDVSVKLFSRCKKLAKCFSFANADVVCLDITLPNVGTESGIT
jgi:hypothetical protein